MNAHKKNVGRRWLWRGAIGLVVLAALGAGAWALFRRGDAGPQYVTETVRKGDLSIYVSATGTLQPTNVVDVGSELSGTMARVQASYNDQVKRGQVLAELNTAKLDQTIERYTATLRSATAKVDQAKVTEREAKESLSRLEEVSRLSGGKVPAPTEMDAARAKYDRAVTDRKAAEASVGEAEANLHTAQTDLTKATIRSPINGVVLKRSVEPGQTVAASLQAPVLFSLAEDLTRMDLVVAVSEADVGQVKEGQKAEFTVDAWPNRKYPAVIKQVRYAATTVDNVVSYQTVLAVSNDDLTLRPGMTASAEVLVTQKRDLLLVSNTALRFKPQQPDKKAESGNSGSILGALMPRPPGGNQPRRSNNPTGPESERKRPGAAVWVKRGEELVRVPVETGLSDGKFTEIRSSELKAGDEVVKDIQRPRQ